jgi:molecular chaperone GrpE
MVDSAYEKQPDDMVLSAVSELRATIGQLAAELAREHDRAQARERVIDRLHTEVQACRAGEARELLRPAITDLRRLRDDLNAQAGSVPEMMARAELALLLESYAESVVLILERCGVITVRPEPLTPFDARQQQASGITETTDPGLDGAIASVVSDGYVEAGTGRQVTPARVVVYRQTDRAPADAVSDEQAS